MSRESDERLVRALKANAFSPMADARKRIGSESARRELAVFGGFKGFGGGRFGGSGASGSWDDEKTPGEEIYYERNTPLLGERSFSDAYDAARKAGLAEFEFNGERYTTDYDPNAKIGGKKTEAVALNRRVELDENKKEVKGTERYEPWVGQIPGDTKKKRKKEE